MDHSFTTTESVLKIPLGPTSSRVRNHQVLYKLKFCPNHSEIHWIDWCASLDMPHHDCRLSRHDTYLFATACQRGLSWEITFKSTTTMVKIFSIARLSRNDYDSGVQLFQGTWTMALRPSFDFSSIQVLRGNVRQLGGRLYERVQFGFSINTRRFWTVQYP